jgi:hypothetical protein
MLWGRYILSHIQILYPLPLMESIQELWQGLHMKRDDLPQKE